MKILIQNSLFHPRVIGGAEISTHLLGRELRRRGIAADAVAGTGQMRGDRDDLTTRPTADGKGTVFEAPSHGLCDFYAEQGPAPRAGFLVRGLNHFAQVGSPRWERLFTQVLQESRPDLVHTNTLVGMTPSIWQAARRRGIPVVHTLRDYHLLCPRTTLLRSSGADCTAPPLPCRVLARMKLRRTGGLALVTAPSRHVLDRHLAAGGFPGAGTAVVPNALDHWPEEIHVRGPGGPVRGLFLGQLNTHKGVALLLEVLAELFAGRECPRLEFDFAGHGPLAPQVEEFCAAHPRRARFHGMVQGPDKERLLADCHLMVVPSLWAEPFGRSIIEGFSYGLPAIAFASGGIPEIIAHQRDGLLASPDRSGLRAALIQLAGDDEMRLEMGRQARRRARDFTLSSQVDRFEELYRQVLAEGGAHAHQAR